MTNELTSIQSEIDIRKLARAYVVLALARDVAERFINERPSHATLHPLLTMLDITNNLLEDVLEHTLPPEVPTGIETEITELLM